MVLWHASSTQQHSRSVQSRTLEDINYWQDQNCKFLAWIWSSCKISATLSYSWYYLYSDVWWWHKAMWMQGLGHGSGLIGNQSLHFVKRQWPEAQSSDNAGVSESNSPSVTPKERGLENVWRDLRITHAHHQFWQPLAKSRSSSWCSRYKSACFLRCVVKVSSAVIVSGAHVAMVCSDWFWCARDYG